MSICCHSFSIFPTGIKRIDTPKDKQFVYMLAGGKDSYDNSQVVTMQCSGGVKLAAAWGPKQTVRGLEGAKGNSW